MTKPILLLALTGLLVATAGAQASERSVTLKVSNMTCEVCPYTVEQSLRDVKGVSAVKVSFADKTAKVTFDDAKTDVAALTRATGQAGYPSEPQP